MEVLNLEVFFIVKFCEFFFIFSFFLLIEINILLWEVNFIVLFKRLIKIWCILVILLMIIVGVFGLIK